MNSPRSVKSRHHGFTLVEIMIVVVIIRLLASMAVTAFNKVSTQSRATTLANNFRKFAEAFQSYNLEEGEWPDSDWVEGSYPTGMEGDLPAAWIRESSVGGFYAFHEGDGVNPPTLILANSNASQDLMIKVDEILDDGNLSQGLVRGDPDSLDYLLE